MRLLQGDRDYSRLAGWIFVLVWLAGNLSILAGLNAHSLWHVIAAVGIFGGVCIAWWGTFRLSRFRSSAAIVVIGIWIIELLTALVAAYRGISLLFLWTSLGILIILFSAAFLYQSRTERLIPPRTPED